MGENKMKVCYTDIKAPRHVGKRKSKLQNICIVRTIYVKI